jgi:hypothetical protein
MRPEVQVAVSSGPLTSERCIDHSHDLSDCVSALYQTQRLAMITGEFHEFAESFSTKTLHSISKNGLHSHQSQLSDHSTPQKSELVIVSVITPKVNAFYEFS